MARWRTAIIARASATERVGRHLAPSGRPRTAACARVQTVAPKSISAWLKSKTWRCGSTVRETVPQCRFIACAFGSPRADEHAEQHARDVRVEDRRALAEREAPDRAGGVRADALERPQRRLVGRQLRRRSVRPTRARSPAAGAAGCCSRAGTTSPTTSSLGRRRQRLERRIAAQPLVILRQHAIDLRLLQHHLGHEDVVRVARLPPRQVAAVPPVPGAAAGAGTIGGAAAPAGQALGRARHGAIIGARSTSFQGTSVESPYLHQDRRRGRDGAVRRHARVEGGSARGRLRRRRRAQRVARAGPRVASRRARLDDDARRASSAICSRSARGSPIPRTASPRASRRPAGRGRGRRARSRPGSTSSSAALPPLRRFILAGGTPAGAAAARRPHGLPPRRARHRRARRATASRSAASSSYINRLSDLLFVMARAANHRAGVAELEW